MTTKQRPPETRLPRINVEVYPDEAYLIHEARIAAAQNEQKLREFIIDAIYEKLKRMGKVQ